MFYSILCISGNVIAIIPGSVEPPPTNLPHAHRRTRGYIARSKQGTLRNDLRSGPYLRSTSDRGFVNGTNVGKNFADRRGKRSLRFAENGGYAYEKPSTCAATKYLDKKAFSPCSARLKYTQPPLLGKRITPYDVAEFDWLSPIPTSGCGINVAT